MIRSLSIAVMLALCAAADAQVQTVTFTQRSPHSDPATLSRRFRWEPLKATADYNLADEPFSLRLPAAGDAEAKPGLIVWINSDAGGAPPKAFVEVLDRHNLIWIGADRSGNERPLLHRVGLALDAAHNLPTQHAIDPDRLYVAGLSGGGRVASWVGLGFADVFCGTLCIVGVDYFAPVDSIDDPESYWPGRFGTPPGTVLNIARTRRRYVLLTGEHDGNRDQTHSIYRNGLLKHGFKFATYLEVPGMGHAVPSGEWFEKAVTALDGR